MTHRLTLCHFHSRSCRGPIGLDLHKFQRRYRRSSYCIEDFHLVLDHLRFEVNCHNLFPVSHGTKQKRKTYSTRQRTQGQPGYIQGHGTRSDTLQ
jgi:hypothetical protein